MSDRDPTLKPVSLDDIPEEPSDAPIEGSREHREYVPDGYDVAYEPGEDQPNDDKLEPYGWTCSLSDTLIHRDGREQAECKGKHDFLWREVD